MFGIMKNILCEQGNGMANFEDDSFKNVYAVCFLPATGHE